MIKVLLLTLFLITVVFSFPIVDNDSIDEDNKVGLNMISFNEPGIYSLPPKKYKHAKNLIVEMWSAGGGGGALSCGNGCGITYGGGGGSGAYIKTFIETKQETFEIIVGKGGRGGNGSNIECNPLFPYQIGTPGGYTSLANKKMDINIVLSGGEGSNSTIYGGYGGSIVSLQGVKNSIYSEGQNGHKPFSEGQGTGVKLISGFGGSAPSGGIGGIIVNREKSVNGGNPGGGGSGTSVPNGQIPATYRLCYAGNGGDGAIVISFIA